MIGSAPGNVISSFCMWLLVSELVDDEFLVRSDVLKKIDRLLPLCGIENFNRLCDFCLSCVLQRKLHDTGFYHEVLLS